MNGEIPQNLRFFSFQSGINGSPLAAQGSIKINYPIKSQHNTLQTQSVTQLPSHSDLQDERGLL